MENKNRLNQNENIYKENPKEKPVVLVTGCSSGIGLAIAHILNATKEFRLILTAREKSIGIIQSQFVETDNVLVFPLDVASEESRAIVAKKMNEELGGVDIIINNAGICYRSTIEEMSDTDEHLQMETNYHGPISLVRHLLPKMRKKKSGKIINISSVSGIMAMPTMGSYSASKFALEGAMEALWYELRGFGITVSLIEPGFVRSNSFERVKYSVRSKISNQMDKPYSHLYKNMAPFVARAMKFGIATPESIAKLVYKVIQSENPPMWVPASIDAEILSLLRRFLPRAILLPFFNFLLPKNHSRSL